MDDTTEVAGAIRERPTSEEREEWQPGAALASSPPEASAGALDDEREPSMPAAPQLAIRPIHPRDLVALRRAGVMLRFDQPEAQLKPYSLLRSGVAAMVPLRGPRPRIFVALADERSVGFAEFQPRLPDQRWLLIALGAPSGSFDAVPVWEALLEHAITAAGMRGVKRLYAKSPHGSPAAPALKALAFAAYASETIFVAQDVPSGSSHVAMRPQEQADAWAIHQLYNAAVPRQVQYAEAFTSHVWDVRRKRSKHDGVTADGWLIEDGHHVVGYAGRMSRGTTDILTFIAHPERGDILPELIDGTLARLPRRSGGRVYCAVRGYQAELATALEERGFIPVLEQDLHVKYTTASVRMPAFEPIPLHLEVRDKLPKRVPSFLHGNPRDEVPSSEF